MSKIRRYYEKSAIYFTTCNTYAGKALFTSKRAAAFLTHTIGYYKYVLNFSLLCYCIMPEHLHIIIQPHLVKYNISVIMKHIKSSLAMGYNNLIRKNGPIRQKRFYDEAIRSEGDLMIKMNYVLQNPVRAHIIKEAQDYLYSSAKTYILDIDDRITDKYISK